MDGETYVRSLARPPPLLPSGCSDPPPPARVSLLRIFMYVFLSGLGLLVVIGLHQLLESRKVKAAESHPSCFCCFGASHLSFAVSLQRRRPAAKVEMGTSSHNGVDFNWIPQETLNQISTCDITSCSPHFLCGPVSLVGCFFLSVWLLPSLHPTPLLAALQCSAASVAPLLQKLLHP